MRKQPTQQFLKEVQKLYDIEIESLLVTEDRQVCDIVEELIQILPLLNKEEDLIYLEELVNFSEKNCIIDLQLDLKYLYLRVKYNCNIEILKDIENILNETEKYGDEDQLIRLASEIAFIFINDKKLSAAESILTKYDVNKNVKFKNVSKQIKAFYYNQYGRYYLRNGNYQNAKDMFELSLDLTNDPKRRWQERTNIAMTYAMKGKKNSYKRAIESLVDAYEEIKDIENKELIARSHNNLASVYLLMEENEKAYSNILIAIESIDDSMSYGNKLNIYDTYLEVSVRGYHISNEYFKMMLIDMMLFENLSEYKQIMIDLLEKMLKYIIFFDRSKVEIFADSILVMHDKIDNNKSNDVRCKISDIYLELYRKGVTKI